MKKLLLSLARNEFLIFFTYAAICIAYVQPLFKDPDVAWHAAAGQLIWSLKAIPIHDTWSFASDQPWYNISWAWDFITSFLYKFFSLAQIEILNNLLHALLLLYAYIALVKSSTHREDAKNVAITLVGMVLWEFSSFRPNIASIFFAIFLYQKLRADKDALNIKFIFPIVCALWVNLHGGFLTAFILLGAFFVEALYEGRRQTAINYFKAGLFGAICCLINPYGYEIVVAVLRTLDSQITAYIQEWQPFVFGKSYPSTLLMVFVILFSELNIKGGKIHEKILFYFWLIMGLISIRSFVYFAILGLPHIVRCFDKNLPMAKYTQPFSAVLRISIIIFLCVFAFISRPYFFEKNKSMFENIPVAEIEYIKLKHGNINLYNEYDIGGYIAYYGQNQLKHFVDGRAGTAFSEDVLGQTIDSFFYTEHWKKIFASYDVNVALLRRDRLRNPTAAAFFKNWHMEMIGKHFVVLARIHN